MTRLVGVRENSNWATTAVRADEVAFELDAVPHGALTYLVLEDIRGAANQNDDQTISVQELIGYASREMPLLSQRP